MEKSYRTAIRITWILSAVCLVAFALMFVLPRFGVDWRERFFFLFFSAPLLLFCLFLLPLLYYYRKKYLSGVKELLAGKYIAHWQYHREEWTRFVEGEWQKTRKHALWYPSGIVGVVVVLGYLFRGWRLDDFKVILPWIFGLAVIGALVMYTLGLRNYRKGMEKVGEVFIGDSGLYFNEAYYTWNVVGARLGKVELLKGDPLLLQFEILYAGKTGSRPSEVRIPVPRAHEKEAEKLVLKFSS